MTTSSLLRRLLDDCWSGSRALTAGQVRIFAPVVVEYWSSVPVSQVYSVNTYHQPMLPALQTRASTVIFCWCATCITITTHRWKVQGEKSFLKFSIQNSKFRLFIYTWSTVQLVGVTYHISRTVRSTVRYCRLVARRVKYLVYTVKCKIYVQYVVQ